MSLLLPTAPSPFARVPFVPPIEPPTPTDGRDDDPADGPDGPDAPESTARMLTHGGLAALLVGEVPGLAWEIAGNEVAVKAVFAAMVSTQNRWTEFTTLRLDGEPFALAPGAHYRSVSAPLPGGRVSVVVLHSSAALGRPTAEAGSAKKRRGARDDARGEPREHFQLVYRPAVAAPAPVSEPTPPATMPDGFVDALTNTLRLPFRREWAAELYAEAVAAGLITAEPHYGSLAAILVSVKPERWHDVVGTVAQRHVPAEAVARADAYAAAQAEREAQEARAAAEAEAAESRDAESGEPPAEQGATAGAAGAAA